MEPVEIRVIGEGHAVVARFQLTDDGDYLVGRDRQAAEIALPDASVSRRHCLVRLDGGRLLVRDEGASNPTRLGARRVGATWRDWPPGEALTVGIYTLFHVDPAVADEAPEADEPATEIARAGVSAPVAEALSDNGPSVNVGFPAVAFAEPVVDVAELVASGRAVEEVEIASVGGGLGSLAFIHAARVHGAAAAAIAIVAASEDPAASLGADLAALGQGEDMVLRSPGWAAPDNLWGFPSYGVRAAARSLASGRPREALALLAAEVCGDGLVEKRAPTFGQLADACRREAARIGWGDMLRAGQALALRKTSDGRYAIALRAPAEVAEGEARNRFVVARHVHLALGRPPVRYSPLLQEFRRRHRGNYRVVSGFEPHQGVISALEATGGTVVVLGEGHGAALVLERLLGARRRNRRIGIIHIAGLAPDGADPLGRPMDMGFRLQADRWPQAVLAGETPLGGADLATAPDVARRAAGLTEAREHGWYRREAARPSELRSSGERVRVEMEAGDGRLLQLSADFVIDCAPVAADPLALPFFRDLRRVYAPVLNEGGRGGVAAGTGGFLRAEDGSVSGLDNGDGRVVIAGLAAGGGADLAADHIAGHMRTALAAVSMLARRGTAGMRPLTPFASLGAWGAWMAGRRP